MNKEKPLSMRKKRAIVAIVDAPVITLSDDELPGDALLKFYCALGWNGEDFLDPCKVRISNPTWHRLYDTMLEKCPDALTVGFYMVNNAPGVDADVPHNKVKLLDGWIKPSESPEV